MAWQSTTTDRTESSYYYSSDVNRVDNNTQYLRDYIETNLGTSITLPHSYSTRNNKSFGKATLINQLEENINTLVTYLGYQPSGWAVLNMNWFGATATRVGNAYDFIYTNANNLEVDLDLIKADLEERVSALMYCGETLAIAGMNPPRF